MNTKIKLLTFLFVTLVFFTFISCEKDLYEENIKKDSKFKYEILTGAKAQQVANRLNSKLGIRASSISGNYERIINLNIGTINYDKVVEVIDSLGKENYTFEVIHPLTSDKKFFNLVLQEKDNKSVVKLLEYTMTDEFAQQYKLGQELKDFKGTVSYLVLYNDSPCPEPELSIQIGEVPTNTSSGGGGNNPHTPPNSGGNFGDNGGHGGGGGPIVELIAAMLWAEHTPSVPTPTHEHSPYPPPSSDKVLMSIKAPTEPTNPTDSIEPCPRNTQIGVLSPINKCSKIFLEGLGNSGNDSDRAWLYNHPTEFNDLMDYIKNTPNCTEASDFANQMVQAMKSNPQLTFDTRISAKSPANIDMSQVQENTPAAVKFRCIYDKLTKSPEFKKLFIDMFQDNTRPNVVFKIADLPGNANGGKVGETVILSDNPYNNTITIDKDLLESGNVMTVLKTVLHECIHAYLNIKLADPSIGMSIPNLNNMEVVETINQYYNGFNPTDLQAQHNFIFNYTMDTMSTVFNQIKDLLITPEQNMQIENLSLHINQNTIPITNTTVPWSWNEYYRNLSLDGLQNCSAFQNEIATVVNGASTNVVDENRWSSFIQYRTVAYSNITSSCN